MAALSAAGSLSLHQEGAEETPWAAQASEGQGPRRSEGLRSTCLAPKTQFQITYPA